MKILHNPHDEELAWVQPGDIITYDFRQRKAAKGDNGSKGDSKTDSSSLRLVQWNIERGYQHDRIVQLLQECCREGVQQHQLHVVALLQELDIFCSRTNWRNEAKSIAQSLEAQIVFVVEFVEFPSTRRSALNSCDPAVGAPLQRKALHGNAILNTHPTQSLTHATSIPHSDGVHWPTLGDRVGEPRDGFRSALRCQFQPSPSSPRTLLLYSLHFEVFCGALCRVRQLSDVFQDARDYLSQTAQPNFVSIVVGGDLNTHAHGIVRFSSLYGTDRMKVLDVGETEASWFRRKILTRHLPFPTAQSAEGQLIPPWRLPEALWHWVWNTPMVWRLLYGLNRTTYDALCNDDLCLWDPFDSYWDVTLNHPSYHGLVQGKLDWLLLSNVVAVRRAHTFNDDYTASDHKGLVMDVQVDLEHSTLAKALFRRWQRSWVDSFCFYLSRVVLLWCLWWAYIHAL